MSSSAFSSPSRSVSTMRNVDNSLDDLMRGQCKKSLWIQYQKERLQPGLSKQSSWPKLNSEPKVTFSNARPASLSAPSSSPSIETFSTTAKSSATPTLSKWRRFMHSLKRNKSIQGEGQYVNHSHNCSNSILQAGVWNLQCNKTLNQDRCTALSYLEADMELSFFAIYGGHGGIGVANYLRDCLHDFVVEQPDYNEGNIQGAITKAFLQVDGELRSFGFATELTGSIATLILVKHRELFCANLGNYRAVACVAGHPKVLSGDHSTMNPKERERVKEMGGTIKGSRVAGLLYTTRSFGDFLLKSEIEKPPWKQVISPVPQVRRFKLDFQWEFVVLGSNSIWKRIPNEEMISYIRSQLSGYSNARDKLNLSKLCEKVIENCSKRVTNNDKPESMSLIIIWFDFVNNSDAGSSIFSSCASR